MPKSAIRKMVIRTCTEILWQINHPRSWVIACHWKMAKNKVQYYLIHIEWSTSHSCIKGALGTWPRKGKHSSLVHTMLYFTLHIQNKIGKRTDISANDAWPISTHYTIFWETPHSRFNFQNLMSLYFQVSFSPPSSPLHPLNNSRKTSS